MGSMWQHGTEATRTDSLFEEAFKEAERHKWIESQKQGHDLGDAAFREWYQLHWPRYCRVKRLEHLQGERRWREFDDQQFGRLHSLIVEGDRLAEMVLDRVYAGLENLDIITWALDAGHSMNRVIDLLRQIDMNRARMEPFGA